MCVLSAFFSLSVIGSACVIISNLHVVGTLYDWLAVWSTSILLVTTIIGEIFANTILQASYNSL